MSANATEMNGIDQEEGDFTVEGLDDVRTLFKMMGNCCRAVVQGRDDVIALVLTSLFADGHVLLEDHPGSGKTTLAKALGNTIRRPADDSHVASFRRVQFTPDLLPSDVTGATMFEPETRQFVYRPGPIFANVVLADEINRTSPKVQASLLEAMAEKQVTVDNETHRLDDVFFVLATQNPLDLAGTYPLPRAQLDRFLFKIRMKHLPREAQLAVLEKWQVSRTKTPTFGVDPSVILKARRIVSREVKVGKAMQECLVDVAEALARDPRVELGISTRCLVLAIPALQVWAAAHGRDYISPRDLKSLAVPMFSHRLELVPGSSDPDKVVTDCVLPVIESVTRKALKS
jgi:MoxR-like ATPase